MRNSDISSHPRIEARFWTGRSRFPSCNDPEGYSKSYIKAEVLGLTPGFFLEVRVVQSFCYVIYFILNIYKRIISLRGYAWIHRASLIPPLFVEVPVPKQESERSCICVLGCRFGSFYDFEKEWFQNCSDSVVFLELLRQCGIFRIAQTVWYFCFCFSFYHSKITYIFG